MDVPKFTEQLDKKILELLRQEAKENKNIHIGTDTDYYRGRIVIRIREANEEDRKLHDKQATDVIEWEKNKQLEEIREIRMRENMQKEELEKLRDELAKHVGEPVSVLPVPDFTIKEQRCSSCKRRIQYPADSSGDTIRCRCGDMLKLGEQEPKLTEEEHRRKYGY